MTTELTFAIVAVSVLIQSAVAYMALRLIPLSGRRFAWIMLAVATALMALRRADALYHSFLDPERHPLAPTGETIALAISLIMLAGMAAIGPIFREMRRDKESLAESERRYRLLFDGMHEGFALLERDPLKDECLRLKEVNQRFAETLDRSTETVEGKPLSDICPRSSPTLTPMLFDALRTGKGSRATLYLTDRSAFFNVAIYRVDEHVAALILSRVADDETLGAARDYFTAVTSHQLRTPLTKIDLTIEMLKGQEELPPSTVAGVMRALTSARDDFALVMEETTLFTRLMSTQGAPLLTPVALAPLLGEWAQVAARRAEDVGRSTPVRFIRNAETDAVSVPIDLELFRFAVSHLLGNAVSFTPDGGKVTLWLEREGSNVLVRVADEGVGMDAAKQQMLFTPYFSFEKVLRFTSAEYAFRSGGIGLGLTLVRMIMELHGGAVAIDSPGRDQGTTVTLTLPTAPSSPTSSQ